MRQVLDSFGTELARPEMAADGLHYNDATNYMHVQLLFNMLCNDRGPPPPPHEKKPYPSQP